MAKASPDGVMAPEQLISKFDHLKGERGRWETHWQDIADFIHPNKNTIMRKLTTEGEDKYVDLLDNTGVQSNELLAGALHGMLTSPNAPWFELTTGDESLDQEDDVRQWLQKQASRMHNVLNNSNFHTEKHEMDLDQTAFGTGCTLMEEDDVEVVRFSTKFIADYLIDEDSKGRINQIYLAWKWSAEKIVEEYGYDDCPKKVREAFDKKEHATKFELILGVYPRKLINPKAKGLEFVSQTVIKSERANVNVGGFESFPFLVPRWSKAAGEKYGRGPGSVALPECKVLNKMNETMLIGAQKLVDPPVQMPDDGFILPLITSPGGVNYRRSGNPDDVIKPIFNDTRIDFGYQALEDRRKRIRDAFYVDQLRLQQGGPMMTATEVMQRTEEQMRLLGPMLGRQQTEFLSPLVDRLFKIMYRRGLIDPAPAVLGGKNLGVKYSSFIARTQRVNDAQNTTRWLQAITPFMQIDPSTAVVIDAEQAVRSLASIFGPPQEIIRNKKVVEDLRKQQQEQREEQINQQMAQNQLAQGAQLTKAMGDIGGTQES